MSQSTDLALESWGIPWELPVFSLRWDPEEVGSKISKRTSQQQDWRTRQWEWGQEGQKQSPPSIASALGCHQKVWYPNSHMSPRVIIWWMIAALHPQFLASDFQLTRMRRKCFVCFGIGLCLLRRPPQDKVTVMMTNFSRHTCLGQVWGEFQKTPMKPWMVSSVQKLHPLNT